MLLPGVVFALTLVNGARPTADIVLPDDAGSVERYAAEELRYHVKKATGCELKIVSEGALAEAGLAGHVFIGATEAAKKAGLPVGKLADEERVLKTKGGSLFLLGGDSPMAMDAVTSVWSASARGTLFAVYDFLENEMGVRWLWPGETGEYVPKTAEIETGEIDRRGREPYDQRFWHGLGGANEAVMYGWKDAAARKHFHDEQLRFMTRHRLGRRTSYRAGHAFGKYVERFYDTHPEYFQLKPDGTRGPWHPGKAGWNCSMCVSNPELPKLVVDDWYAEYSKVAGRGRFPELPVVNACENDGPGACCCEKCRAWDGPDPRFKLNKYWNGTGDREEMCSSLGIYGRLADMNRWGESATQPPTEYSANVGDRYAKFYNAVLAEARRRVPEAKVVAYAYQNYLEGPMVTKVDPGVIIEFVPRMYLPYDKAESDLQKEFWMNWRKAGVKELIYRPNFTHALGGFPVDQARQYCEDLAWFTDRGLVGIALDSVMGSYSAEAMHDYAITRAFREPKRGYEAARADMLLAFGGAAKEVNRYFDYIEAHSKAWTHESFEKIRRENPISGGIFGGGFNRQANILGDFYSEQFFTDVHAMLDAAEKAAGGDEEVIERVRFLRKGIVNTELTRNTRLAKKAWDADPDSIAKKLTFEAAFKAMNAYRESIQFDCALNLHREAINEFKQLQWPHEPMETGKKAGGVVRAVIVKTIAAPKDEGGALAPNAFEPFPAGTITPRGWLGHQLSLQTEGLHGRLYETSEFLVPENGWLRPDTPSTDPCIEGWEEQAYWLRTFVKIAVLTRNERMLGVSEKWIEAIIAGADSDGWFGPRGLRNHRRAANDGTICHDIWAHMVMTEALMTWYDYRGDRSILKLLADFARWCNKVPYNVFLLGDSRGGNWHYAVQRDRACDIVPSLFRLYSLTGDNAFLEFADRCFRYRDRRGRATTYLDSHNVNFAERFAYDTVYSRRSRHPAHRAFADYWFDSNALVWGGEMPRWAFASDECARVGCFDARYATETCTWGEFTRSFQLLGAISGDPKWGDRAEDVVFNDYPVAFTPDWKKVHYLTAPNQVSLDAATDHNYQKPPPRLAYSAKLYRCCRHNAGLTLPLFAEKLTQRTPAGDLVFWAYAPHSGAADGVKWQLETRYPFREEMKLGFEKLGKHAVYLRIPAWAKGFTVRRGRTVLVDTRESGTWLRLEGDWAAKEELEVSMKAECVFTPHVRSKSVTIDRGPLSYSLAIREEYREVPEPSFRADAKGVLESHFPEKSDAPSGDLMTEVVPKSPWNYALDLTKAPVYSDRAWSDDCFAQATVPCKITAWGRKVPEWTAQDAQPAELQESPVRTSEPLEKLSFIPMGAARCRLTTLPTLSLVDNEMMTYKWTKTPEKTVRANRPKIINQ